jgi:hypothetical protein
MLPVDGVFAPDHVFVAASPYLTLVLHCQKYRPRESFPLFSSAHFIQLPSGASVTTGAFTTGVSFVTAAAFSVQKPSNTKVFDWAIVGCVLLLVLNKIHELETSA